MKVQKQSETGLKVGKQGETGVKVGKEEESKEKVIGIIEEICKTSKDEKGQNEEGLKAEIAAKEDRKLSFGEVVLHEIIKMDSENLPILEITGSDANITCFDKSIFTADTEDEDNTTITNGTD